MSAPVTQIANGICGFVAGWLLLWRVPLAEAADGAASLQHVSVVVPARNEERNLPRLLSSLQQQPTGEVIVVDDNSSDGTADAARSYGATVLASEPLPPGWTGKNFACFQGASAAHSETLLFLDADTWLAPCGGERMAATFAKNASSPAALSFLPFHITRKPYEELSLFFNLLMAFGAGGFGVLRRGRLFGQSMLISRGLYQQIGTHAAVRGHVLENFNLAGHIRQAGGRCFCRGGRGVLHMRMFPDGFRQLSNGWTKAFASGAAGSDGLILAISICWLSALTSAFIAVLFGPSRETAVVIYALLAAQLGLQARQVGSFRWYACALYPVPLMFFMATFARSLLLRRRGRGAVWKGRAV